MRSAFLLAALLTAVALGALLLGQSRDASPRELRRGTLTLLGDSLNVGVEPYLPAALPGWKVVANDLVGRTTAGGIAELEAGRLALSGHVAVSLGTNDPPAGVEAFRTDVARLLELLGPGRCLSWATIWRDGAPNEAFNAVLRAAAGANRRLRLIEWAEMVEAHPDRLAGDGVHGSEAGYIARAAAIAEATRDCAPAQTAAEP